MKESLADRIKRYEKALNEGKMLNGEKADPEKIAKAEKQVIFYFDESIEFLALNSMAFAAGIISQEDSQLIYSLMGEGGEGKINKASLGTRMVLMQVFSELLALKRKKKL